MTYHCNDEVSGKSIPIFFIFIILLLNFSNCEEEKPEPRTYPRVITLPVINITENGATFRGEIYEAGTEQITEHGFVWNSLFDPKYNTSDKVIAGPAKGTGEFSADILTTLVEDMVYKVRAFAKTDEHIVYGTMQEFISLGSGAPKVIGFEPSSGSWGDTITIRGENFSYVPENNIVLFNFTQCTVVESTDTTLSVLINPVLKEEKYKISVGIQGNFSGYTNEEFFLILPTFSGISPISAFWGDTVAISFHNFSGNFNNISLTLGSLNIIPLILKKDTLRFVLPEVLATETNTVVVKINNLTLVLPEQVVMEPPVVNSLNPIEGTWGTQVTLTGKFNKLASRSSVAFGSVTATILAVVRNMLIIKVPNTLRSIKSTITCNTQPFIVTAPVEFTLKPPEIRSFSPSSGASGTVVAIKGKYFGVSTPGVKFGESFATVTSFNDSIIITKVPSTGYGPVKISVTQLETATSSDDYNITNPKITSIYPLTGTYNDEVTIEGENFVPPTGSTSVKFGNYTATIMSVSGNKIVAQVPVAMDSIPSALKVTAGVNTATSTEMFTLSPHQIISVFPDSLICGGTITVTGFNFNPVVVNNKIYIDIYQMDIVSSSTTEIIATVPQLLPRGPLKLSIVINNLKRYYSEPFSHRSPWKRIPSPVIMTNSASAIYEGITIYAKSIKNKGYLASSASDATYEFDPSDYSWKKLNILNPSFWYDTRKMGEVVCRDTFYLIAGWGYINYFMYSYYPGSVRWEASTVPSYSNAGVAFSMYDKIYFGLNYSFGGSTVFWECDPGNNYTWTQKGAFPGTPPSPFTAYFTIDSKGYVVFANNQVWQFDADLLSWTRKSDFPGPSRQLAVSFVINGLGYMGTGKISTTTLNDLWEYNPVTDSWILVSQIPVARTSAVAFSIGNKAYLGYGTTWSGLYFNNDLYDFYEFDPNYTW